MSRLPLAHFTARVGETFRVVDTAFEFKLDEAAGLARGDGYALVFTGPSGLSQGTYHLEAEDFSQPIFIVPIGPDAYEAVFN